MIHEHDLHYIADALQGYGLETTIRGSELGAFVFVEGHGKAVEISRHQDTWWVEFWDASKDVDALPVREKFFDSTDAMMADVTAWLLG